MDGPNPASLALVASPGFEERLASVRTALGTGVAQDAAQLIATLSGNDAALADEWLIAGMALEPALLALLPWLERLLPSRFGEIDAALRAAAGPWASVVGMARAASEWPGQYQVCLARLERSRATLPLGLSDFERIREDGLLYVDKSEFIGEVVRDPYQVLLFPAPRRFGKTVTLQTLRAFFDRASGHERRARLFDGLAVREDAQVWSHQGRYPVVYVSLKDTGKPHAADFVDMVRSAMGDVARGLEPLIAPERLRGAEARHWAGLIDETATDLDLRQALRRLTRWLHEATGERAVVLIDEYDEPIHRASDDERDTVLDFLRDFISAGLKDNSDLHKGVITGILRIGRESLFSGFNNVGVHTMLSVRYATAFGFDAFEVALLARARGVFHRFDELEDWYNGFVSGTRRVFNPWSVLSALDRVGASSTEPLETYWANSGSRDRLDRLLERHARSNATAFETLLSGARIRRPLTESIAFRDLDALPDGLWTFLLYTGYLTAERVGDDADFWIPNREASIELRRLARGWLTIRVGGEDRVRALANALLLGDEPTFEAALQEIFVRHASFHDKAHEPENSYHLFVLGLLVCLEGDYEVRSNRESGFGRYDVLVTPKHPGLPGVVLEFKSVTNADADAALTAALEQIAGRGYAIPLRDAGAFPIYAVAIAGESKRIRCRFERLAP